MDPRRVDRLSEDRKDNDDFTKLDELKFHTTSAHNEKRTALLQSLLASSEQLLKVADGMPAGEGRDGALRLVTKRIAELAELLDKAGIPRTND